MGVRRRVQAIAVTVVGALACCAGTASAGDLDSAVKAFDLADNGTIPANAEVNGRANLTAVGDQLFYTAFSAFGNELFVSDGTQASTKLVKEIFPSGSSFPRNLTAVGDTLFFAANDNAGFGENVELWRSDGTAAGTEKVEEINPNGSSNPQDLTAVGDRLFFTAYDSTTGRELYTADASGGGANLIDINEVPSGSNPFELAKVGNDVFFAAFGDGTGLELYKSDGTQGGTSLVADINPGTGFSSPAGITDVGGVAYFQADDGSSGIELYKTNATGTGASRVADINPGGSSNPIEITPVGDTVYFKANDGARGFELWKSNGTSAGTDIVEDLRDPGGSNPIDLTEVGGTLFFQADVTGTGKELWKSDGTPAGTDIVENINPESPATSEASLTELTSFGGKLYFYANDSLHGFEPWVSDGTTDGTFLLTDTNPGSGNGLAQSTLAPFRGSLFYNAANGTQIWKITDTIAPTVTITSGPAGGSTITTASATFGFSSDDLPATFACRVYPTGSAPPAFGACSGAGTHTTGALANGSYTFDVQGADISGNTDTDSRNFTVAVPKPIDDNQPCAAAKAKLTQAEAKLDKAKASLKKAKKSKKAAKIKKAKAKVKKANAAVKTAKSEVADAC